MTPTHGKTPPRRVSITRDAAVMMASLLMDFHKGLYHGKHTHLLQASALKCSKYLFGMLEEAPDTTNWLEELELLEPWVDHEETFDRKECTDRCPCCRIQQLIVREKERCRLDSNDSTPTLLAPQS